MNLIFLSMNESRTMSSHQCLVGELEPYSNNHQEPRVEAKGT